MNQLARSHLESACISAQIISCEILETEYWHEDYQRYFNVWGVQIQFADDQIVSIPDLCTKREDAEKFIQKIDGAFLCSESLPDIVDDFLSELYGLRMA